MKKLILFISLLGIISQYSYAWYTTAAKYYPLAVGNLWSYHIMSYQPPLGCNTPTSQFDYIVSIIKDTVFNGHRYFKFSDGRRERIDSVKMNVYYYDGNSECLVDSLLAKRFDGYLSCDGVKQISDTNLLFFAGQNWPSKGMTHIGLLARRLVLGLGVYMDGYCLFTTGAVSTLNGCIINGIQYGNIISAVDPTVNEIPMKYSLSQNYPNPFNPSTKFKFDIPLDSRLRGNDNVTLKIFDLLGREVATLVNEQLKPGSYEVEWDGSNYPSGVYFYKLITDSFSETRKMVLVK